MVKLVELVLDELFEVDVLFTLILMLVVLMFGYLSIEGGVFNVAGGEGGSGGSWASSGVGEIEVFWGDIGVWILLSTW